MDYIVIISFRGDAKHPVKVSAENHLEAITKAVEYAKQKKCTHILSIEAVELLLDIETI